MKRRSALIVAAGVLPGLSAFSVMVRAQAAWPGGTVRIVTPTPVGVGIDALARRYAEHLGRVLNTSVFVENRAGAAGTLGTGTVAKAPADGLTLLISTSLPFTTAPHLFSKLPYDAQKDLLPVAPLYRGGSFVVAGPAFEGRTLKDLVALAKRKPNAINYASYGPGSTAHLGMELLQDAAGIELTQIPYKQSVIPDLIGGQVSVGWEPPNSALPSIRSGQIKALAYSGDKRSAALPDVPTLGELFPGLELFTWVGVWVPAGTPEPIVARLHAAFAGITADAEVARAIADAGNEPMTGTPAQMAAQLDRDSQSMRRLIKAKNIRIN